MLEFLSFDYRECLICLQRLIDIHPNMAGCLGRAITLSSVACLLPESSSPLLGYRGSEHSAKVPAGKQNTQPWHRRSQSAIERPLYHITPVCCGQRTNYQPSSSTSLRAACSFAFRGRPAHSTHRDTHELLSSPINWLKRYPASKSVCYRREDGPDDGRYGRWNRRTGRVSSGDLVLGDAALHTMVDHRHRPNQRSRTVPDCHAVPTLL